MARSRGRLLGELHSLSTRIDTIEKTLKSLDAQSSPNPIGCTTFTAKHGSSVISQLEAEIDTLADKMVRKILRDRAGDPLEKHIRSINAANSVLRSHIQKESKEVEDGMVRQYFVQNLELVVEPMEFPIEHLHLRIGKGDVASTQSMLRQQTFNTTSLESFVNSQRKEYSSIQAQMKHIIEETFLKSTNSSMATNRWSESATDLGSEGGFLICTELKSDYRILFCPHCSQELIDAFDAGVRAIVFPPLPKTILNLNLFCTENRHKDHSYEDCIEVTDLESRINQIREKYGAHPHHTEVIHIENPKLSQSHGTWAWLKHN